MQRFAEEFGTDVEVDSAGTHDYHVGEPADRRMQEAAEARGYELTSKGRQIKLSDLDPDHFDLVSGDGYSEPRVAARNGWRIEDSHSPVRRLSGRRTGPTTFPIRITATKTGSTKSWICWKKAVQSSYKR